MQDPDDEAESFETTYPKYPFSELVRLALAAAGWFVRRRRQSTGPAADRARTPPGLASTRERR